MYVHFDRIKEKFERKIMKASSTRKEARIHLRVNSTQKELFTRAAQLKQKTVSDFILENASQAAQEVLQNQTHFALSPEKWKAFCEILDRPPKKIKALQKLLRESTIFNEH